MTSLCNRCELLFDECRPLAGERCGLLGGRAPVIRAGTLATRKPGAAVVLDHRTQAAVITTIVVVNFQDEP